MTRSDRRNAAGQCRRLVVTALAATLLAGAVAGAHASAQTMLEPERITVSVRGSGPTPDPAAMRRVIVEAGARHEWRVTQDVPGRLTLRVASGDLSATVDVLYDGDSFQIQYRDSARMDYEREDGRRVIHPRYNKWVTELGNEIRREARNGVRQRRHAGNADVRAPGEGDASGAGN